MRQEGSKKQSEKEPVEENPAKREERVSHVFGLPEGKGAEE